MRLRPALIGSASHVYCSAPSPTPRARPSMIGGLPYPRMALSNKSSAFSHSGESRHGTASRRPTAAQTPPSTSTSMPVTKLASSDSRKHDDRGELLGRGRSGAAASSPPASSSSAAARTPGGPSACRPCRATPSRCARRSGRAPRLPAARAVARPASPTRRRCPGRCAVSPTAAQYASKKPRPSGSSIAASAAAVRLRVQVRGHRREAHDRGAGWSPAAASRRPAARWPTRSTSRMRRQSAIVGEIPATCATPRSVPSRRALARRGAASAAGSVMSTTTGSHAVPGAGDRPRPARRPRPRRGRRAAARRRGRRAAAAHAAPMPLPAPVTIATEVIDRSAGRSRRSRRA